MLEIQELLFFQTVAQCGSFSGASNELNYAQSNISTRIRQLERKLDVQLFYRNSKGIELTEKGRVLLDYTNRILHTVKEAEDAVREDGTAHGSLSIGSLETIAHIHLPTLLAQYHKQYPAVQLSIHTATSSELIRAVMERKLDAAFISGEVNDDTLISVPFTQEKMVLASSSPLSIEEIEHSTALVFAKGCYYRHLLEQLFKEWNIAPKQIMEFNSTEAVLSSLCAGFGFALLPESLLTHGIHSELVCMDIPEPYSMVQSYLVYRKDYCVMTAFERFISEAKMY